MPVLFVRSILLYGLLVAVMRCMGKRQLGQFQPYELVLSLFIANVAATPLSDPDIPLWQGALPTLALLVVHALVTLASLHSDRVRAFLSGRPTAIMSGGVFDEKEMRRLYLSLSDVLEGFRACGIMDPAQAGSAIVEANGSISAFPRSDCRPASAAESGIALPPETIPMTLIMDGRAQPRNLQTLGKSLSWLEDTLAAQRLCIGDVFFCSVDNQGAMTLQDRNARIYRLETEARGWGG